MSLKVDELREYITTKLKEAQEAEGDLLDVTKRTWSQILEYLDESRGEGIVGELHDALKYVLLGELEEGELLKQLEQLKAELTALQFSEPLTPKQLRYNLILQGLFWWTDLISKFIVTADVNILALLVALEKPISRMLRTYHSKEEFSEAVKELNDVLT